MTVPDRPDTRHPPRPAPGPPKPFVASDYPWWRRVWWWVTDRLEDLGW